MTRRRAPSPAKPAVPRDPPAEHASVLNTPPDHARLTRKSTPSRRREVPVSRNPMPAALVDVLSTLLAELVLDDLREHPDLRVDPASRPSAAGR